MRTKRSGKMWSKKRRMNSSPLVSRAHARDDDFDPKTRLIVKSQRFSKIGNTATSEFAKL